MEVSTAGGQAHSTTTPEQLTQVLSSINAHNQSTKALQGQTDGNLASGWCTSPCNCYMQEALAISADVTLNMRTSKQSTQSRRRLRCAK
jgi:hypothetical protein